MIEKTKSSHHPLPGSQTDPLGGYVWECGGGEIRTRESFRTQTFQVCGINHYPTPPLVLVMYYTSFTLIHHAQERKINIVNKLNTLYLCIKLLSFR